MNRPFYAFGLFIGLLSLAMLAVSSSSRSTTVGRASTTRQEGPKPNRARTGGAYIVILPADEAEADESGIADSAVHSDPSSAGEVTDASTLEAIDGYHAGAKDAAAPLVPARVQAATGTGLPLLDETEDAELDEPASELRPWNEAAWFSGQEAPENGGRPLDTSEVIELFDSLGARRAGTADGRATSRIQSRSWKGVSQLGRRPAPNAAAQNVRSGDALRLFAVASLDRLSRGIQRLAGWLDAAMLHLLRPADLE